LRPCRTSWLIVGIDPQTGVQQKLTPRAHYIRIGCELTADASRQA
jgi:hypothetical protein